VATRHERLQRVSARRADSSLRRVDRRAADSAQRRPHVALAGHLDVGTHRARGEPRIEGNKLYGAGAADMKSGLALISTSRSGQPSGVDLTWSFMPRKGPFAEKRARPVLEQDPELSRVDVGSRARASDNKLQLGCGGSLHATARFAGAPHTARDRGKARTRSEVGGFLPSCRGSPAPHLIDGLEWRSVISRDHGQRRPRSQT